MRAEHLIFILLLLFILFLILQSSPKEIKLDIDMPAILSNATSRVDKAIDDVVVKVRWFFGL